MLEVEGLAAGYGRIPVLAGISFSLGPGERLAVVGANGSGKTTLVKALMGLLPAGAGRIGFAGHDITRWPPHRRHRLGIGYVPQGRELFPALSLRDNLRMGCLGTDEDEALARVLALFPVLEGLLARRGDALSGGEQQIAALARALCASPRLLLLDEPSEGLQPSLVADIARILDGLRGDDAPAVLLIEQNLAFAATVATRALVMRGGTIVRALSPQDLAAPEMLAELLGGADDGETP